jgi:hypothetical protein
MVIYWGRVCCDWTRLFQNRERVRRYCGTEGNIKWVSVLWHDASTFNIFVNLSDTRITSNIPNSQMRVISLWKCVAFDACHFAWSPRSYLAVVNTSPNVFISTGLSWAAYPGRVQKLIGDCMLLYMSKLYSIQYFIGDGKPGPQDEG